MNAKARILIVDDEEVVRRSFTRILGATDCHVRAVSSWTEVAQAMQEDPFDVVLLDLRMPGLDGMTVLRGLKQRWPSSEVIIITGYPTIDSAKEAVALGAYDYLAKPVDPEQVVEASNAAMRHKRWALQPETASAHDTSDATPPAAASREQPVISRSPS